MTSQIFPRKNDALNVNPDTVSGQSSDINLTTRGSDWYWATKPRTDRIFHYITGGITMIAAISDHRVAGVYREIFHVRYIDWFITTPLLLMDLLLTAGMPWPTVLWVILVDWVMIVTGLMGALVKSSYK
ncbi:hypothetical protein CEP54_015590 [Fusarium duplospermum]|uniref:Uncharacterized protein n=1 Tax=Fusarium duplospermum TaxID=1325734 RepID=A0A428NMY2_9HYPO|nr:hypothetical protein CEP54_015590 [Fusarium duplospermum]